MIAWIMNFSSTLIGLLIGAVLNCTLNTLRVSEDPVYEVGYRSTELDRSCYENIRHLQLSYNTAQLT